MKFKVTIEDIPSAFIEYSKTNNHFIAYSTFVDESLRGKGVGKKLYEKFVSMVKESSGTFSTECSYISKMASSNVTVKKIYK